MTVRGWKIVVFGGAGAMGKLLVSTLRAQGASVWIVDPAAAPAEQTLRADSADAAVGELLARMDAAILCLPESVTLAVLAPVLAALPPNALLVETNSTKRPIADALAGDIARGREVLSLNPMFAPSLGWADQNVAAIRFLDGPKSAALLALLVQAGARLQTLSAEEHDRATAAIQAAAHAALLCFGETLHRLGHHAGEGLRLATPPYRTLLAMLARIASGQAHVYHDIQARNDLAKEARDALAASAQAFANDDSLDSFERRLARIRDMLGSEQAPLAELCARIFSMVGKG